MRKGSIVLLAMCLVFALTGIAHADSLIDSVQAAQQSGGGAIQAEIDRIGLSIVNFVRSVFAVIAVVFVIWAGFVFWGAGGDPNAMMRVKKLAAGFIICIVGVYSAETIVGGILGLLGYGA